MADRQTADEIAPGADTFVVVANGQGQYSVWPAQRKLPAGWRVVSEPASQECCLDRIDDLWIDMRPAGLKHTQGEPGFAERTETDISPGDQQGGACM
ncbi:MbtH family protein [Herbaspirillum autotrophicum]|uniref:MbtH family protein n=1 Tax=Herbaspirillum autotrophicum TaxID=180195 RepID=UPI0009F88E2A|nr:MbtH family NRPS accessory protein [Herbaspirillum autotrophicum]